MQIIISFIIVMVAGWIGVLIGLDEGRTETEVLVCESRSMTRSVIDTKSVCVHADGKTIEPVFPVKNES